MIRAKTFDATGIAPGGRLYAGDLNLIQDLVAALTDLTQNIQVSTVAYGEAGLLISRFGAGEFQFAGLARFQGITRMLAGFVGGTYTTTTRNAIAAGSRPYGLVILNSTTNQYEWNSGTDAVPVWQAIAPAIGAGSIGTTELANLSVTTAKLAAGVAAGQSYGTVFPTTGLYNGYNFTFFHTDVTGTVPVDYIYRADLDGTHPWQAVGTKELLAVNAADFGFNTIAAAWQDLSTPAVARAGDYIFKMSWTGGTNDTSAGGPGSWIRMTIGGYTGGARSVVFNLGSNGRAPSGGQEVRYVAGVAAAALVHLQGQVAAASNGTVEGLSLVVVPVRVV